MFGKDREQIDGALSLADDALEVLVRRVRALDPETARLVFAVREVLSHATCLQRAGKHADCTCPKDLARQGLDCATEELRRLTSGGHRRVAVLIADGKRFEVPLAVAAGVCGR